MPPNGNPYDLLLDGEQERQRAMLNGTLSTAVDTNPDAFSAQRRVARYLGYPTAAVEALPKQSEREAKVRQVTDATANSPALQNKYLDPDFAKLAFDDAGKLSEIEQAVRQYGELKAWKGPEPTTGSVLRGLAESLPQGFRAAREGLRQQMGDLFDALGILPRTEAEKAEQLRRTARAQGASDFTTPEFESSTAKGIYGGLASTLRQAPGIALSVVTGNPTPVLASIGVQTQAEAYGKYRARGATPGQAFVGGTVEGAVEVGTELLPMGFLVNKLGKVGMTEFFTGMLARELPSEQVATLLQDAIDTAIANPDKTWADYLNERPEAAYQTLVATITQSAVMGGVSAAARRALRDTNQINDAETDAQRIGALFAKAGESKLRERDPQAFAELVQGVADQTEGAPKSVYIDAATLAETLQQSGLNEAQLEEVLPGVAAQLPEALAAGGTVELPIGDLVARVTGTPLEQALLPNLRTTPDALSQAEAQEAAGQAETYLQQQAERVIAEATDADAMRASAEVVKANVLDQLNATKRFRPDVNEAYATLARAFYTTMAGRTGVTPEEMFARYPLRITAEQPGGGVFNDTGTRPGEMTVEGYHFSMVDRPVLSTGYFGTGLKGSARDEIQAAADPRIKQRLSFYFDKGTGIRPEAGVGGRAHRVQLTGVYDADADPLGLRGGDARAFESKVLDAGFRGYATRMDGTQPGQVIMLGPQTFQPELLGAQSRIEAGQKVEPLPRQAPQWQTSASGTPEAMQALLERRQGNPAWAGFDMQVVGGELQVRQKEGVLNQSVSTRLPTAKKATENPLEAMLVIGLDAAKADPKAFEKNVELIRTYPNFRDNKSADTPDKAAEQFIKHVVDNLLWLHDNVPPETRQRSKLWYDGARAIVDRWTEKYQITDAQASGMLAVLSPQKDWFQNVSLAERVLDVMTTKQDFAWSDEMSQTAAAIGALNPEDVGEITGKTLGELDSDYLQAMWVRVYDQTYHERGYRVVTPEGEFGGWVTNADGETKSKTAWGSFNEIGKAVSIFKDGSIANISASLGEQHKVRNFYNNIFNPASTYGDVTIDTHAVAAGLLRPLSGSATEVLHNFGAGGAASSSIFGSKGTYGIYAEAYRRAAAERGILAREMQSITWEAVRGLYTAGFKAQAANVAAVDAVWGQYKKRRISLDEARKQLLDLAGGVAAPEWERPGAGAPEAAWASSYTGELRQGGGAEGTAGGGTGSRADRTEAGGLTDAYGQTGNRAGRYSGGSLAPLEGAPAVAGAAGPDPRLVAVAEQYAASNGIPLRRQAAYVAVDPERAARIAAAYEAMPHAPQDPAVKEAYQNLIQQTVAQYQALEAAGYKFWFMDPASDPYQGNPWNAMRDLRANQSMAVFPTEAGFGTGGQVNVGLADPNGGPNLDPAVVLEALRVIGAEVEASAVFSSDTEPTLAVKVKRALTKEQGDFLSGLADQEAIAQRTDDDKGMLFGPKAEKWGPFNPTYFVTPTGARGDEVANPLLADTGITWAYGSPDGEQRPVLANDLFRAVHDAFGHGLEGAGFRAQGEENAWQAHARLFTGSALGALTTETRGQNSWLNYGPHGEANQTAKVEDTVFAEQKTGLMPEWTWTEGRAADEGGVLNQSVQPDLFPGEFATKRTTVETNTVVDSKGTRAKGGNVNSKGQQVTATKQGLQRFWDWFAGSEATDDKSRPMVLYHSTNSDVTQFETNRETTNNYGILGDMTVRRAGIFLTPDLGFSQEYLRDGAGQNVMPVYAALKNPLDLRRGISERVEAELEAAGVNVRYVNNVQNTWELFDSADDGTNDFVDALKAAGYDGAIFHEDSPGGDSQGGTTYVAFEPNQIKSAIGNDGTFDANDPRILSQGDQAPRATFSPSRMEIALLKDADLSSFLHEMGHFFLEVQADLASQPGAPQQIVDDFNTVLKWFGIKATEDGKTPAQVWASLDLEGKRPYHERWAESWEQYLFEGKAPSVEMRGVFQRFREFMISAYKSLKNFLRMRSGTVGGQANGGTLGISDEVRGVFDRLIATDEQIAEAQSLANFEAVFKSAEQAGMTPEEWAAYQAQNAAATADATETLQKKSLADMKWVAAARGKALRKAQADVKEKRDAMRAEVTAEVEELPIEQARAYIKALRVSAPEQRDALKDWGDRRDAATERAREEVKAALLASPEAADLKGIKKGQYLAKNKKLLDNQAEAKVIEWEAANPRPAPVLPEPQMDSIAEQFGFTSGDELAKALVEQPPAAQFIEALTEQRLLETYGEAVTADGMARAANEAVHNEARRRFVATELAAMQRAMSATAPTGKTDKKGRPLGVNVIVQAAKAFAETVVNRRKILDLKPAQHAAAATRAAAKAAKLTAEGKTAEAIGAKRDQLLSEYTARYTEQARQEVLKGLEYLKKFDKASIRAKLPAGHLDQIDQMLERFDLRVSTSRADIQRSEEARVTLAAWVAQQHELGLDPVVPQDLLDNARLTSYKQMTVEEFRALVDGVKSIDHLGRMESKLLAAQDKREFDIIANEIAASIVEHGGTPRPVQLEPDGRLKKFFKGAWADHRKLNSLIRQMDGGKDNGPFYRALVRSMNDAGAREATMIEQATEALAKIYAPIEKLPGGFSGAKVFIPEIRNSLSRAGRLAVALNWGNPQNRQRVVDGDGWTEAQVNAILRTLSPVELKFVNDVWAHIGSYWPEIKAKQERVTGVAEEKVDAVPFEITLADGSTVQMRGGYYPIKYDADRSIKAEKQEALETAKEIMRGAVARPTTRRGHTKARVDEVKGRPVRKDLSVITQHVNQVVHDLAWHEWFIDANRLLNDKRIAGAIRQYHGNDAARVLKEAADAIAVGDAVHQGQIDRLLLAMRSNVSRSIMGASLTTAIMQPFGLTQSMARVGVVPVLKGAARWAGDAARMESTVGWINEKSEFMRLRGKTFNRELREISQRVQGKSKFMQVYDASLFMLMQKLQLVADVPTWVGAYEKALAGGVDESAAVALADEAVLSSQGGGTTKDLAAVQRNMPFLTQFYSYFNTTLNLVAEKTATTDFKDPKAAAGWMADMALLTVIPAILPALLTYLLKGGGEDDDAEDWAKRILEWQAGYLFGMFVGLRELPTLWSPFDYAGPPAAKVLSDGKKVVQQAGQGEIDDPAIIASINLLGSVFGLPTVQVTRSYKGWKAWSEGDAPASSILFGPPPKD